MKKTKPSIEVAAAVLINNKQQTIFCAQRKNSGELAKKWEFPGGKIENGETPKQALIREIFEELSIFINPHTYITTVTYEYNTFHLTMHAYLSEIIKGEIVLAEHLDAAWLSLNSLETLDWATADLPIINTLKEILLWK